MGNIIQLDEALIIAIYYTNSFALYKFI